MRVDRRISLIDTEMTWLDHKGGSWRGTELQEDSKKLEEETETRRVLWFLNCPVGRMSAHVGTGENATTLSSFMNLFRSLSTSSRSTDSESVPSAMRYLRAGYWPLTIGALNDVL